MKKNTVLALWLAFFAFLELTAQDYKRKETRLPPPFVVNLVERADWQKAHPRKAKQRVIEQGEDKERKFKYKPRPIPANAITVRVPEPVARPAGHALVSPAPAVSFNGIMDNGTIIPPDIRGAAGPNHIMQTTNQEFKIYTKTGTLLNTVSMDIFFSAGNGSDYFDPHVVYDPLRNRFLACVGGDLANGHSGVFLAISHTDDPSGNWYVYPMDGTGNTSDLLDFPLIGYNNNWVVITGNDFTGSGVEGKIFVFNRDSVYNGGGSVVMFTDNNAFTLAPAQTNDTLQLTEYLVQNGDGNSGGMGFVQFSTITGTPNAPVYAQGATLGVNRTWSENNLGAPQDGTINTLEDGDTRICNAVYINGTMWFAHTVFVPAAAPTHDAVDWWQVDPTVPSVVQFGRVEDTTGVNFYFYPSINVNSSGDALLGFCKSSTATFASAAYAFHAVGDPPNTMQDVFIYKAGLDIYFKTFGSGRNRWGDYTFTAVDPVNGSFWNFGQWANFSNRWATTIVNVLASVDTTCYPPVSTSVKNLSDTSADLSWIPLSSNLGYLVSYREAGSTTWLVDTSLQHSHRITGLNGSTIYEWQVQTLCQSGDTSPASIMDSFKTRMTCQVSNPSVIPGAGCGGTRIALGASGTSILTWFADSIGKTVLDTGSTFLTPPLAAGKNYYVESQIFPPSDFIGPVDSSLGTGTMVVAHNFKSLSFTAIVPFRLVSVLVYAQTAGNRSLSLKQNGAIIRTLTATLPVGSSRILLNFDLAAGSGYELGCQGTTNMYMSTSGANYPYTMDGILSITGNNNGPGFYPFFYNWEVQLPPCTSERIPVHASVLPTPVASYSQVTNIDTTVFTDLSTGGTGWSWDFGDPASGTGDTSTLQHPVHIFSATDAAYIVCLVVTDSVSGCTDTTCRTLLIGSVGMDEVAGMESIAVFPNPSRNLLTISFGKAAAGKNWTLRMSDPDGRILAQQTLKSDQPLRQIEFNMESFAKGIYLLTLQNETETLVRKVIKE